MIIRQAILEDEKVIDSFDRFGGSRNNEIIRKEMWVAILEDKIAGYVTFNHSFYERPFLKYINTHPDFRRRNVAEKMMNFIEEKCKGKKLFISTEADNLPMITLLDKLNYKMVGIINGIQEAAEVVYCKELQFIAHS
jgi:ribosomal protein S18 acetylase RimI-like enzyme